MDTLTIGSQGDRVRSLQELLTVFGGYKGQISAKFDAETAQAVAIVQTELKLVVSGAWNEATELAFQERLGLWLGTLCCLGYLNTDPSQTPTRQIAQALEIFQAEQKQADTAISPNGIFDAPTRQALVGEMASLQSKLYFLGHYKGFVDGRYNPFIVPAIREFQSGHNLPTTGIRDPETRIRIIRSALIAPDQGDVDARTKQEKVASLQRKLNCCDLYHGPQHGDYDADTLAAVSAFQHQFILQPGHKLLRVDGICDDHTWWLLNQEAGTTFAETFQWELDALDEERTEIIPDKADPRPAAESAVVARAHKNQLVGLAFSGGGIRSATFNLGISQAFAEKEMLREFHYLSTVSGGGYIGSWLSKWIHEEHGEIRNVEAQLRRETSSRAEPDQIRFLRQYSNYLTPKVGLFGADTWAVIATYVRNVMLNMVILIGVLSVIMLAPRILLWLVTQYSRTSKSGLLYTPEFAFYFGSVALVAFLVAVFFISLNISLISHPNNQKRWLYCQEQLCVLTRVVAPLMISGFCGSVWLWYEFSAAVIYLWDWHYWIVATVIYLIVWGIAWRLGQTTNARNGVKPARSGSVWRQVGPHLFFSIAALVLGHTLIGGALELFHKLTQTSGALNHPVNLVAFGMPVALTIFGISMVLLVGLLGRAYSDRSREWWSRMGGWTIILTSGWVIFFVICFYGPPIILWWIREKAGAAGSVSLAIGWLAPSLGGILFGQSAHSEATMPLRINKILIALAPPVFVLGIALAITIGIQLLVSLFVESTTTLAMFPDDAHHALSDYFDRIFFASELAPLATLLLAIGACGLVAGVLAWRVDINKFSLYMMYRNRLVRSYLGASNAKRQPHPFVGFDAADDPHLAELLWKKEAETSAVRHLQKPFHLINTALNLVNGKELAWQERKAASFTFSPGYCGFELPPRSDQANSNRTNALARGCFRSTREYGAGKRDPVGGRKTASGLRDKIEDYKDEEEGVKLGQAMAISGAAASPNMGFHSNPALAFLMTAFNVRLGRWNSNPRQGAWRNSSPTFGLGSLIKELIGSTDADSRYVYLSDGGHFENLGLYELVRRRCALIVAIDSGADGGTKFNDLGGAMRKCFTDFGIEIDLQVKDIVADPVSGLSKSHCTVGEIKYGLVDAQCESGILLYIKPSLTGNEPADLLNYRKTNNNFPHQSTADQFFDETQFESYRKLGFHIGHAVLDEICKTLERKMIGNGNRRAALIKLLRQRLKQAQQNDLVSEEQILIHELKGKLTSARQSPAAGKMRGGNWGI